MVTSAELSINHTPAGHGTAAAARAVVKQHVRRLYPDTSVCRCCSGRWRVRTTPAGTVTEGCESRLAALQVLGDAGQVDDRGVSTIGHVIR